MAMMSPLWKSSSPGVPPRVEYRPSRGSVVPASTGLPRWETGKNSSWDQAVTPGC